MVVSSHLIYIDIRCIWNKKEQGRADVLRIDDQITESRSLPYLNIQIFPTVFIFSE